MRTFLFICLACIFSFSLSAQSVLTFDGEITVTKGAKSFVSDDVVYEITIREADNKADLKMSGLRFAQGMPGGLIMCINDVDYNYTQQGELIIEFFDRSISLMGKDSDSPIASQFKTPFLNYYAVIKDGKIQNFFDCAKVTVEYNGAQVQ